MRGMPAALFDIVADVAGAPVVLDAAPVLPVFPTLPVLPVLPVLPGVAVLPVVPIVLVEPAGCCIVGSFAVPSALRFVLSVCA